MKLVVITVLIACAVLLAAGVLYASAKKSKSHPELFVCHSCGERDCHCQKTFPSDEA